MEETFHAFIPALEEVTASEKNKRWGLILASTKGEVEDLIRQKEISLWSDPYKNLLNQFKKKLAFPIEKQMVVSNACASSHGAIELAERWLKRQWVDHVLVVAVDFVGPFIYRGFSSLRALSDAGVCRPFDNKRDGLLLGDAMGVAVLSHKKLHRQALIVEGVNNLCESFSITRPDTSGETLAQCFTRSLARKEPDVMIAHGTATYYNDMTEAAAIEKTFSDSKPPLITATKWAMGHSLGASGLADLSVGARILQEQRIPAIATLRESDFNIREWLVQENKETQIRSILISSLGFGGICSSLVLRKGDL